ncbi:MAG TPA: NAD-dependent epimerase/dehydratase family protein [Gemmatimonadaceae bacterium]|nr:NAD-dependent epimerase/dehydratase family protein [Gemmatimonadaceae bacterium]
MMPPESAGVDALIGFTGFVGGNLARQRSFDLLYNSTNIADIRNKTFGTLVCAGVKAEKWRANQDPAADLESIERLWKSLTTVTARKFVLISTVDVYPAPNGVDETTAIDPRESQPYGRHRYELEERVADRFDSLILRLPALFGRGLKKNALFDLLHGNQTDRIDSRGVFQFYDVGRLSTEITIAVDNNLSLVNVATEPLSIEEIASDCFGEPFINHVLPQPPRYDFRSIYASLFGGSRGYLIGREELKQALTHWIVTERAHTS